MHFLKYGKQEGRLYSKDQLFFSAQRSPLLLQAASQPLIQSVSQPGIDSYSVQRVAVLVQLHQIQEWEEIRFWMQSFDGQEFDLLISLNEHEWTPEIHARLRQDYPSAKILIARNKDRNIHGHLALMSQVVWHEYDIFCLIRVSPNIPWNAGSKEGRAEQKQNALQDAIVGSKEIVQENLAILRGDRAIGLIGTREQGKNTFAANSNLLVKRQILQPIYDRFQGIFESETADIKRSNSAPNHQFDQTLERLISYLTQAQGLQFYWQESQ